MKLPKDIKKIFFAPPNWLVALFIVIFILRIPTFFDPYFYGDECIYLTLGEAVRKGLTLYRDIHDNKPPFLYLLAAISGGLFWFRVLLCFWNLATIYFFFLVARTFYSKKEKAVAAITTLFALVTTLPTFEGNIANAELFMILPTLAGILRLFCGKKRNLRALFEAGLLFSLAALFKFPAAFDFAAVFIFLTLFSFKSFKKEVGGLLKKALVLTCGFLLPIAISLIYYLARGAFGFYLQSAFLQNIGYLGSWQTGSQGANLTQSGLAIKGLFLLGFVFFLWTLQKKLNKKACLVFLWFGFALFAALLSERPYPHYLIQVLPPLFLSLPLLINKKAPEKIIAFSLLVVFFFSFFYFGFWYYKTLPYYQNFVKYALGRKTQEEYFETFGQEVNQTYKLAHFINKTTQKNEKVFAWGEASCFYALSRRLPAGRYTTSYHTIDFDGYGETIQAIKEQRPRFIVDLKNESRPFTELSALVNKNYSLFKKDGKAEVFVLNPIK